MARTGNTARRVGGSCRSGQSRRPIHFPAPVDSRRRAMNILRIVAWDLRRVGKDWMAAVWMLAMPLVMAFVFGSAMQTRGPQATWVPVINLDQHELSAIFIEQLRQEGYYIELNNPDSQADLKKNWPYGIVIPAGFGDAILKGQQVQISFVKGSAPQDKILEV